MLNFEYNIDIWPSDDPQGHFRSNRKCDISTHRGRYTYSMSHFHNSRTSNKGTLLLNRPCISQISQKITSPKLDLGPLAKKSHFEIRLNRAHVGDLSGTSMGISWCSFSHLKWYNFENFEVFWISFFAHNIWTNYRTTCKLHTFTSPDNRHILSPHSTSGLLRFPRYSRVDPLIFGPFSQKVFMEKFWKKFRAFPSTPATIG